MIYIQAKEDMITEGVLFFRGTIRSFKGAHKDIPQGWEEASEEFYRAMEEDSNKDFVKALQSGLIEPKFQYATYSDGSP